MFNGKVEMDVEELLPMINAWFWTQSHYEKGLKTTSIRVSNNAMGGKVYLDVEKVKQTKA